MGNIIASIEALIARGVTHALTLWPEWQVPILELPSRTKPPPQGDKDVEMRSWAPSADFIGRYIALHWGMHIGGRKGDTAKRDGCHMMLIMARRAGWQQRGIGPWQVELTRGDQTILFDADKIVTGAIGCIIRINSVTRPRDLGPDDMEKDPYYTGECGWRFDVVEKLAEPIPCKGAQGLWPLASLLGKDTGKPQAGRAW